MCVVLVPKKLVGVVSINDVSHTVRCRMGVGLRTRHEPPWGSALLVRKWFSHTALSHVSGPLEMIDKRGLRIGW